MDTMEQIKHDLKRVKRQREIMQDAFRKIRAEEIALLIHDGQYEVIEECFGRIFLIRVDNERVALQEQPNGNFKQFWYLDCEHLFLGDNEFFINI